MNELTLTTATPQADAEAGLVDTFDQLQGELYRRLYGLLGNRDDAQDALQQAFLHCWRARSGLPELRNIRAWVRRVSLNAGRDLWDRQRRRRAEPLPEVETDAVCRWSPPDEPVLVRERHERLCTALEDLRPEEKQVFLWRHDSGLDYGEIARRQGCPVGTAKTRMRAALRKLQGALQERN